MANSGIEEKLAHLERGFDELNDVVIRQSEEIARLTKHVAFLMEREAMREADAAGGVFVGDEKPPHY